MKYPDIIRYYRQEKNLGLIANYGFLMSKTAAKYIAILESDDYWTDPCKLQMQISIMEQRSTCGLVYTDCSFLHQKADASSKESEMAPVHSHEIKTTDIEPYIKIIPCPEMFLQLIKSNSIPAVTVLFRRALFERYCNMEEYIRAKFVTFDYPVWLTLATVSDFCRLNINTATYTINKDSVSNTVSYESRLNFQKGIDVIHNYICNHIDNEKITIYSDTIKNERTVKHMLMELQFGHKEEFYKLSHQISGYKLKWLLIRLFPLLFMLKKRKYLNNKLMQ